MKCKKLVIDTAAFIKNLPLWEYSEDLYTVKEVINEIRDKATKRSIDAYPVELKFRCPSASSVKFINDFTRKTGDYANLSLTDTKILALTYELEVETKQSSDHLRTEPKKCRTIVTASKPVSEPKHNIEGWYVPSNMNEEVGSNEESSNLFDEDLISCSVDHPIKNEDSYRLTIRDLFLLNKYFSECSYLKGPTVSNEDFLLIKAWKDFCPIFNTVAEAAEKLLRIDQFDLILQVYRQINSSVANSFDINIASENNELGKREECVTYQAMIKLMVGYNDDLPHLLRWAFHIMSLSNNDIKCPISSVETSLRYFIELIRTKDDDASQASVCSPTEESLQEKLQSLEITEEEEIESDEGFEKSSEDPESVEEVEDENEIFNDDEYEIVDEEQEDDDDDEGWITPSSLKKMKENKIDFAEQNEDIDVACITADYAMQNTLRHIGLSVIGVDGKIITNVRTFILRCYACFKTTDKMELLFCKHCGNKTLKRVSVTMNPDGTQKIWISTRRPINTRGTKFTLPMPKGGKHAVNPILVADQREAQQLAAKRYRMKNDPMHEDYGIRTSPFITRDVYSRSFHVGVTGGNKHRGLYYWEQKNPNEPMKKNKSRRKKRQ